MAQSRKGFPAAAAAAGKEGGEGEYMSVFLEDDDISHYISTLVRGASPLSWGEYL